MGKLYLVTRNTPVGYDEFVEFVVLAKSPGEARYLCSLRAADEGKQTWLNGDVQVLGMPHPLLKKESRIIVENFNAG